MKRTLQKLGEGVFGEVYSCYTPEGDGLAVKVIQGCGVVFGIPYSFTHTLSHTHTNSHSIANKNTHN